MGWYDIAVRAYTLGIKAAARFGHQQAAQWVSGRKKWRTDIIEKLERVGRRDQPLIWMHCASLGEFEQGRAVLEYLRNHHPTWRLVLTFFSPSGYEIRKNYAGVDLVAYLPADTKSHAEDIVQILDPQVFILVKYEFWFNVLAELNQQNVPVVLIAALFRKEQPFFRWYGAKWRKCLLTFERVFTQDEKSVQLLKDLGYEQAEQVGDPRIDRVASLAESALTDEVTRKFAADNPIFICGSTWPEDEKILLPFLQNHLPQDWKVIVASHRVEPSVIHRLMGQLPGPVIAHSQAVEENKMVKAKSLVIDGVGLLNRLYRYGKIAYIGGGFGQGIHNTLEPAAFGLPIIFGPRYKKFAEANYWVTVGGAFSIQNEEELKSVFEKLTDPIAYQSASTHTRSYINRQRGAADRIGYWIAQELISS